MFEVELKAWVHDKPAVLRAIESFATFEATLDKRDQYYRLMLPGGTHRSVRIRTETRTAAPADTAPAPSPTPNTGSPVDTFPEVPADTATYTLVTFKNKETRLGTPVGAASDEGSSGTASGARPEKSAPGKDTACIDEETCGSPFEVNEEHEFTVSDAREFELLLLESGYQPALKKHKTTHSFWHQHRFHLELCTIEGLGDFLEIETFAQTNDSATVNALHAELVRLIVRAGLSESDIESRYYSELLAETAQDDTLGGSKNFSF